MPMNKSRVTFPAGIIRIAISAVIIRGIYRETGIWTATFAVLVTVALEVMAFHGRFLNEAIRTIRDILKLMSPKPRGEKE